METTQEVVSDVVPTRQPSKASPPWQWNRPLKTVALYLAFVVVGITNSMLGPSVVSLEVVLDSALHQISAGFVCQSVGYLLGAVLCGFVYGRMNKELLFTLSLLLSGSMTVMMPHSHNLPMYLVSMAVMGFALGFIDTGSQSYILKLWEGHRFMPAIMQALHSMWSVGSIVGPFILHPFLADITQDELNNLTSISSQNWSTSSSNESSLLEPDITEEVARFRYGFIIAAISVFATAIVFLAAFLKGEPSLLEQHRKRLRQSQQSSDESSKRQSQVQQRFRIRLLCIVALYFFFFSCVENLPANFIASFVVMGLGWENHRGALITSLYWGTHGAGRVLGIVMAMCMSPKQMVITDVVVSFLGFFLMFFSSYHFSIIWVAIATAGLGIATLFPSGLLFVEKYTEVTGSASSVVMASASCGSITSPILTGYLMEKYSYLALAYVCIASAAIEAVVFVGIVVYTQRYGVERHDNTPTKNDGEISASVEMKPLNR